MIHPCILMEKINFSVPNCTGQTFSLIRIRAGFGGQQLLGKSCVDARGQILSHGCGSKRELFGGM